MNNTDPKTIYLIRHGQTDGNTKGLWLGARSADKLNDYGKKQAEYSGEYLKKLNVHASKIFSSPVRRTLEHAEILQKYLDLLPIEKIHSLSEINLGILEDRSRAEGLKLVPEEVIDWETNLKEFQPPLGESALEASERFYEIIEFIAKNCVKQDIIIVSHGVVIKLLLARILKSSLEVGETQLNVPPTSHGSISIVKYNNGLFSFQDVIENKYLDSKEILSFG
jgi:alpha-ribazole phosphatase